MDDLLLNLVVMLEDRKIKGVTPLWAAQAAKQLVIRIKHRKISVLILIAYKLKCKTQCKRSVGRTFAHSIFEAAALQTGFHGTHGIPSGSATVSYVRKNTLLAAKGGCICTPPYPPKSATAFIASLIVSKSSVQRYDQIFAKLISVYFPW